MYAWHVHHEVLVERLTEPLAKRQAYIRAYKPTSEIPTRLRLLKLVGDQGAVARARRAYEVSMDTAWRTSLVAAAETQARRVYIKAMEALHALECPNCPWDGHTIFPNHWVAR